MKCNKEQTIEKLKAENERLREQLAVVREVAIIDFAGSIAELIDEFLPKNYKISQERYDQILKGSE